MRSFAASALCLLALQVGCSDDLTWRAVDRMIQTRFPAVPTVTTDSLAERLAAPAQTRPLLLDARSPAEYAVSHLRGARRVDPEATRFPALDTLARDAPIVVYCSVGYRSARIAARLRARGFENVANLRGSIFRWANEGRPVVRGDSVVGAVHPYDDTWGTLLDDDLHALPPPSPERAP
jgi:rhodanese-related sulfurtransferase